MSADYSLDPDGTPVIHRTLPGVVPCALGKDCPCLTGVLTFHDTEGYPYATDPTVVALAALEAYDRVNNDPATTLGEADLRDEHMVVIDVVEPIIRAHYEARLRERLAAAIHRDYEAAVEAGHSEEFLRVYLAANTEAMRIVRERP